MLPALPRSVRVLGEHPGLRARVARLWRVEWGPGAAGLLRRHDPTVLEPDAVESAPDLQWLHEFLRRLAGTGFPAPHPLPIFDGASVCAHEGALWDALSYVPGRPVGWDAQPGVDELGAFLARYHDAARSIGIVTRRPISFPLPELARIVRERSRHAAPSELAEMCDELGERLASASVPGDRHLVIHGDFTAHNVLAVGELRRPAGVIDFGIAHVERPVADIAFGLWRSGRPLQGATWLDDQRVSAFVRGYARVQPLDSNHLALIPHYLWGRGVQMLVKASSRGRPAPIACIEQIAWLRAHEVKLADLVAAATGGT